MIIHRCQIWYNSDLDAELDSNSENECDIIESEDDSSIKNELCPDLTKKYDSDSSYSKSVDEEYVYLLCTRQSVKEETPINKKRASVIYSLKDKNGDTKEYLGMIDTGSTGRLLAKMWLKNIDPNVKRIAVYGIQMQKL